MFKILSAAIIILFVLSSCSTQKEITLPKKETAKVPSNSRDNKEGALEHVINGATAEAKGDISGAILEYQDALRLDPNAGIYYALAKNYFSLNKIPLALQNAKMSIQLSPEKIEYYDLLADIFSSANQDDSAAAVLEKIISLDSSQVAAYYQLARLYEADKPLQSIEIYNKVIDMVGPEWTVLLRLIDLNEKLNNVEDALANIKELLDLDPGNVAIQKLLIDFYVRNKMDDEAIVMLDDLIELTPDDLELREKKAQLFIEQNEWEKASKEYAYIMAQPNIPLDIKIRIGASYFSQSLQDSTLLPITRQFFENMDKDTVYWQVKMYLGAIAINEGDDSTAIQNFRQVTELARWNVDAWIRLGGLYFDNRKYEEAAKFMNEAIESFPENFAVNLILGLSLAQNDKQAEAEPFLKKAVDLNPTDITALSAYGFNLNQLKQSDEAILIIKKALSLRPDDVNLLGTLGLIYDSKEMWAECDSIYEAALVIDSANALVNNNYAYSLSERGIQLERALKMAQLAISADSANSSYLDTIGWIYYKLGTYQQAKYYIEKAIEFGGEKAVMLEHLGDIVYKMGQVNQAQELWQKSFSLDSSNEKLKMKIEKGEI